MYEGVEPIMTLTAVRARRALDSKTKVSHVEKCETSNRQSALSRLALRFADGRA